MFFGRRNAVAKKLKNNNSITEKEGHMPSHVAIIPDGNGRWARKRGMPRDFGHREGAGVLHKMIRYCSEAGISYVTVYAFSTENWKRPRDEVDFLMSLLLEFLSEADKKLSGTNIRINIIGDIEGLPNEVREKIPGILKLTSGNTGMQLNVALNYGGRKEITDAVRRIAEDSARGVINPAGIDEKTISTSLYTGDIPDPDLLIRTGGECRSSNFLLWQMAYTEYWFTETLWPDMKIRDMEKAFKDYMKRNRRYGGI